MSDTDLYKALIRQEINKLEGRIEHYAGRFERGTHDHEDRVAHEAFSNMASALHKLLLAR